MARNAAPGQASSMVPRGSGAAPARTGPAGTTAGNRRRPAGSGASRSSAGTNSSMGMGGAGNMFRFYTDDAPGLRITPVVVLVMSLCFIGFVTLLHIFGKIYSSRG
mmetsp:Transcript_453/g.637  ORF Transcript_453/g.637 Transcript_453/m.637 type:complete len:106 (-) Transcript_453:257-574(-)